MPPDSSAAAEGQAAAAARRIALQMLEERGRGAVLVGVSRVDASLERLLQAVLRPAPGATDTFFQPERPLGSFGARITLAARLGVIDPLVEQTLRRVRNAFAHSTTTATLHDPGQADRLAQAYAAAHALWAPLERILQEQSAGESTPLDHALRDYILGPPCAPLPALSSLGPSCVGPLLVEVHSLRRLWRRSSWPLVLSPPLLPPRRSVGRRRIRSCCWSPACGRCRRSS